jgi:hypothetical protein
MNHSPGRLATAFIRAWVVEHDEWYHGAVTVRQIGNDPISFHVLNDSEATLLCALLNGIVMDTSGRQT